ncbi:uncharacterized protein A4U43_C05F19920 [Asparagus officinalis]|uniref:Fungal lipase-type domain-containing protein n=1 Tax=Asparagus officinalis TaxID=4686 RepID=A0A5P1ESY5_ASPOF|nr:GDSL esterase/lipase At4g10955-like [Asparagus officinalis]ONK69155.1 uncharacterized protein A4U43_C05F19920 [Asparagus officinalis]
MTSQRGVFEVAGPVHLTSVDWTCPHHCRSVAASLVQGAYVLERDRQINRHGHEARAPSWWNFFHFELIEQLIDTADSSIFGAIYQFKPPTNTTLSSNAPGYVIAFRGTITKKGSRYQDLKLDLRFLNHGLQRTSRFEIAMQAVQNLVSHVGGDTNIWLAGHSLGSAIALLAGKSMVKSGVLLETYLFNPPFVSAPIEKIKSERVKNGMRIAGSYFTAKVAASVKGQRVKSEEYFAILSSWVPYIFVNKEDNICSGYVGYFENRKKMEDRGAGEIGRLATQNSVRDVLLSAIGKECEPLHILPSARVTVNLSGTSDFKTAHGIHQWWRTDAHLQSQEYFFR